MHKSFYLIMIFDDTKYSFFSVILSIFISKSPNHFDYNQYSLIGVCYNQNPLEGSFFATIVMKSDDTYLYFSVQEFVLAHLSWQSSYSKITKLYFHGPRNCFIWVFWTLFCQRYCQKHIHLQHTGPVGCQKEYLDTKVGDQTISPPHCLFACTSKANLYLYMFIRLK